MGQTQFRSDDTVKWWGGFGRGLDGNRTVSANSTEANVNNSLAITAGQSTTSTAMTNFSSYVSRYVILWQSSGTGIGNWELNQIASIDGSNLVTFVRPVHNTYTDSGNSQAQMILMKEYLDFTVNSSVTLTVQSWDGNVGGLLPIFVKKDLTISGAISGIGTAGAVNQALTVGCGCRGGAGRWYSNTTGQAYAGDGTNLVPFQYTANGHGGGGGMGDDFSGGGGGNGTAGGTADPTGRVGQRGVGGSAVGNVGITSLFMGGGGGGGSEYEASSLGGSGGSGAGAVLIIAKNIVSINSIALTGGAGASAVKANGGGGAGGSCLIKCQTAALGTNKLIANGGAGGNNDSAGGNGGVGRIHIDYKTSYTGTTTPTIDARQDTLLVEQSGGAFLGHFV